MLFDKPTKTAFVLPMKNGATSLFYYLDSIGFKPIPMKEDGKGLVKIPKHALPRQFLADYPQLGDYKFYGFFRNPLDRFISLLKMFHDTGRNVTYRDFLEPGQYQKYLLDIHLARQVEWLDFPNTTALDFENFESEVKAFGPKYGYPNARLQHLNAGKSSIVVTKEIEDFVRDYYAIDYKFAKDVLGKDY